MTTDLKSIINHNYGITSEIATLKKRISDLRKQIKPPCAYCRKDGFACEGCSCNNYREFEKLPKETK